MSSVVASRSAIRRLINAAQHTACPCHGCRTGGAHNPIHALQQMRKYATPVESLPVEKEYAFEVRLNQKVPSPGADVPRNAFSPSHGTSADRWFAST